MIVTLLWLVVKWKFLSLSLKLTLEIFFFLFILWNLTKTINRGFYSRFNDIWNYIDSKIFFFRIWGFRGIGNIFFWGGVLLLRKSVADARIGQTFIQLVWDCWWVDGKESNSIEEFAGPWSCWGPIWFLFFFSLEFRGWNKRKKGVAYSKILWIMSDVFQSRWCFGFVCDLAKWNESGKGEVPIYWQPRGFLIKLKRNPARVWSGKTCFLRGLQTNVHGNRNLMKKMGNTLLISILRGLF